jgi:Tol biopolymer transport system component
MLAVPLTLAVLLSVPTQRAVAGMNGAGTTTASRTIARAESRSSLGVDASLHRMPNGKTPFVALASQARPMRNGKLAFVDRGMYNESWRIAVVNPDGSDLRGLTPPCPHSGCVMFISSPAWSPDGAHLAFFGRTPTSTAGALFLIGSNGREEKQLVHCGTYMCGYSRHPWSPDGARIVFVQRDWLAIVNAHTGSLHRVTHCTVTVPSSGSRGSPAPKGCSDSNPSWSPDGSHIIFFRALYSRHTSGGEYIMNANGTGVKPLGRVPAGATDFAWSPNGHRIAFDSGNNVYAVNADGSGLTLLVSGSRGRRQSVPSWSPDGKRILYFSTPRCPNGYYKAEVWVMNAAGRQRRRLYHSTRCIGGWGPPVWSPDGKRILFTVGIYRAPISDSGTLLIDVDGRHLFRLPELVRPSTDLTWQPVP